MNGSGGTLPSQIRSKKRVERSAIGWHNNRVNDYDRIARIIRYLDAHHTEQPSLVELARIAGLSQFHFHRLFSTWAGITPKDFLQCLTLEQVKKSLTNGASVLDATLDAGLSSPGRLHDLCVDLEAASPGELKFGGEGCTIHAGFALTPFGRCLIGQNSRGVCHLSFVDSQPNATALHSLRALWPAAKLKRDDLAASRLATEIFCKRPGRSSRPTLRIFVKGTPFQVRVWRALLEVEPGSVTTYGRLAQALGQPSAARAVGSAVGANPVAYLIPCHRVIRETGVLGGYHWDPVRKHAMLARESVMT